MTTRFFPGSHDPDADHLNTLLDTMRSGMRAPDAALHNDEATDLAATADQFRTVDDRTRIAAGATDITFDSIWEDMMSAHAVPTPVPFASDPPRRKERVSQRVIPIPPMPKTGWLNGLLSTAIVALMIAGLIGTAWNLRDTGSGDPGGDTRLAATALDGTPDTDASSTWLQPIHAEDCVEPTESGTATPTTDGAYQPASTPTLSDAEAVAEAARIYEACGSGDISQKRIPIRERWQVYFNVVNSPNSARDVMVQHQLDMARELSPLLLSQNPADYIHTTDADLELNPELVFLPSQAMQLANGRIAIPMSYLVPSETDATPSNLYSPWPTTSPSSLAIEIQIYRQSDGNWTFDEKIPWGCIGDCEETWDQLSQRLFLGTPAVTMPETTSAGSLDWMAWITPKECSAEPMSLEEYASILSDVPDTSSRSYIVDGPADQQAAQDAVETARANRACIDYGMEDQRRSTETDAHIFYRTANMNMPISQDEYRQQEVEKSKLLSTQLDMLTADDFYAITATEPPEELIAKWSRNTAGTAPVVSSMVYNPATAIVLADGRVVIPETAVWWEADSASTGLLDPDPFADGSLVGPVLLLVNEDGLWQVDERLTVCIDNCGAYWARFGPGATPPSIPEVSPVTSVDWFAWMTPEECTVEPIRQDAYADIMRNEPEWPSREYTVIGTPEPDMANAAAAVAREHEACKIYRETDQKRALESPSYIYVSNNGFVADVSTQEQRLHLAQHSQELSAQLPIQNPLHYIAVSDEDGLPSDAFVGDIYLPENALLLSDGRIVIPATKVFASDPGGIYLPGGMIILTNESGAWLVDEGVALCVGDCEDYWTKSMGTVAKPTAPPVASPMATPAGQPHSLIPNALTETIHVDLNGVLNNDDAALANARDTLHIALDPYNQGQMCWIGFVSISSRAPDIGQGVELSERIGQMIEEEFPHLLPESTVGSQAQLASESIAIPNTTPTGEVELQIFLNSGCEPASAVDWRSWMTPEECTVEPISQDAYADIMRHEPEESVLSNRSYTVIGTPEPEMAQAVVQNARQHEACSTFRMTDQKRALESPAYVYISNAQATSYQNPDERLVSNAKHGEELSAQLPVQDPTHYIAVTTSDSEDLPVPTGALGMAYDPGNALLLEDGRIAIPGTKLFASEPPNPYSPGGISIFTNESGEWLLDERLAFCVGECEEYWAGFEGQRVVYDGTTSATPIATPEN